MRLIGLAVAAASFAALAAVALQMQVTRTESQITVTGNTGTAFNTSSTILSDGLATVGLSMPQFFLAGVIVLVGTFFLVVLR